MSKCTRCITTFLAHLCQLLLDRLHICLCEVGANQSHTTVDVETNTTRRHYSLATHSNTGSNTNDIKTFRLVKSWTQAKVWLQIVQTHWL